jgi:acetyl esterase/lipase
MERHSYGPDLAQFGELYLPPGDRRAGTVVVIHGGFWRARYDCSLGRPLAADLAARGYVTWNLEYRRVGTGGGWPHTLDDVSAGIDRLAGLDVDTTRVVAIGHSAGGQLAVWAAARAAALVPVTGVVAQAGLLDLVTAATTGVGHTAVLDLLGGPPDEVADRYAAADPLCQVPVPARVVCLHSAADDEVPIAQSRAYVAAASAAGGDAVLIETAGDHDTMIDPSTPDWALALGAVAELLPSR